MYAYFILITFYYNDLNVGKRTYTSMYLSSTFIQSFFSVMLHTFPWTTSDPTFERYYITWTTQIINQSKNIMIKSLIYLWRIQSNFLRITPYQIFSSRWKPDVNLINIFCHNWKTDVFRRSCFKPHDGELTVTYYRMIAVVWVFVIALKIACFKIAISF